MYCGSSRRRSKMKVLNYKRPEGQNETVKFGRMLNHRASNRYKRLGNIQRFLKERIKDDYSIRYDGPAFENCCRPKKPWPEVREFFKAKARKVADIGPYELYSVKHIYNESNGGRSSDYRKLLALWNCHRLENSIIVFPKT